MTTDREWIRTQLANRGYTLFDLAKAWDRSRPAVSRFLTGEENADPSFSKAIALSQMLQIPLDELGARLGLKGDAPPLPTIVPNGRDLPPVGSFVVQPRANGRRSVVIHLEVPAEVASQLERVLDQAGVLAA